MSEVDSETVSRVALGVEYNGSAYHGWQKNPKINIPTVQENLEKALSKVADHAVSVVCAGRTDAGVHATEQVVHFDTSSIRPLKAWVRGTNAHLPHNIAVKWALEVQEDFHARFSAFARRYRYVILNTPVRPAILHDGVTYEFRPLDAGRMDCAAQNLLGEQDFTSFRASICQSRTAMRNVQEISVKRFSDLVVIEVKANAFLHHMIRNIAGVLIRVGIGDKDPDWVKDVLAARDRTQADVTASPKGLYFVQAYYPDEFDLPKTNPSPFFMAGI